MQDSQDRHLLWHKAVSHGFSSDIGQTCRDQAERSQALLIGQATAGEVC